MEDTAGTVKNKSMRKSQKKQIENMLDLLEQAHTAIKKAVETGNTEIALTLLEQAQDSAIQVGGMIEESLGEEFATVRILESYCEQVYQSYEMIRQQRAVNVGKVYKSLRRELIRMENSVRNDIAIRTSVVFLPYKASMWDSLESVWKAADADPDCDAYVIPIPYFDKNPDGSFSRMHYEGDLYPKDVAVVSWEEFDLAREYPDIIYIHNPYDECNHVTSVHPAFYARELRKFTDKLVYIPYFILPEINPDDQVAIDGMKHFCFTPGTIYAHQVIVQSEDMRQIYINEYSKAAKEMGLSGEHVDRKFLEKKFLGTGSPKIDKVLSTKKEDLEIPAEWLKVIEKSDGSWKKIIFYNTGVSALLEYSEKMIRKIESVFAIFKENRDEVALLWRPHPLIQATIESMRPQLWEDYRGLKERYIAEGWGIYDDTADMDRAVALSDAYYGDGSSVVQLCQKAGLPVMLQDVRILDRKWFANDKYLNISIIDADVSNDKLWFIAHDFNGLFFMDMITRRVKLVDTFPNEEVGKMRLYESMKIIDEKIYFTPFYAKSIAVFDMKKNTFYNIALSEEQMGCSVSRPLFGGMEIYERNIYMIPVYSKAIVCLDVDSGELTYITEWHKDVENLMFDIKEAYFRRQTVRIKNKIMAPFCNANAVLEFDCETKTCKIHELGSEKRGYSGICFDGSCYWLSPRKTGDLVRWDATKNVTETVKICPDKEKDKPCAYVGITYSNKNLVIFPAFECTTFFEEKELCIAVPNGKYTFVKQEGDIVSFYNEDLGTLVIENKKRNRKSEMEIRIHYREVNRHVLASFSKILVNETKLLNVRVLIGMLEQTE